MSQRNATACTALALAVSLSACGGEGGGSTVQTTAVEGPIAHSGAGQAKRSKPRAGRPSAPPSDGRSDHGGSGSSSSGGQGAASFETAGGDNSIQRYGAEASHAEIEQASAALHAYLAARAAGEWARACKDTAASLVVSLEQASGAAGNGKVDCPRSLAAISVGMPSSERENSTKADVGAMRVKGSQGILLYHGAGHTDYVMPMSKDGAQWKVAAPAASVLP
jgi:hypothetical protein